MNFLGCEGAWIVHDNGVTDCQGELKTYTVQEMRDYLTPAMTTAEKAQFTSAAICFLVVIWIGRRLIRV